MKCCCRPIYYFGFSGCEGCFFFSICETNLHRLIPYRASLTGLMSVKKMWIMCHSLHSHHIPKHLITTTIIKTPYKVTGKKPPHICLNDQSNFFLSLSLFGLNWTIEPYQRALVQRDLSKKSTDRIGLGDILSDDHIVIFKFSLFPLVSTTG